MQLDDLVFKVNTTDIERANKLMQELGASIQTLDKKIADTSNKQSLVEARQARAAKDTAKARLENAKAVDVETKAEERKQKTIDKTTAAQEKAAQADKKKAEQVDRVTAALQKQNDINDYLLQGFSRGEAQRLAQLKSLGAVNEQLKEYAELLNIPRKIVSDPFDNSASGASKASKELTLLKDVYRMTTAEIDITAKQMRELTKDKLRSIEVAKAEGKSIFSVREEIRNANAAYIETATSINKYAQVEKSANQARKDAASATRAIAQEDERMAAALNTVNASMSRANTDSLVKYESNLRRVGLSQEAFTAKLAAYKAQLQQVQAQEEKRSQQHLARALSPQLTDIAVSLYSGQAPLTVLLQQGGQIADLFRLSGVEAQNFGKAMRDAFGSMIPVIATVGKGMAQFAGSILVDAGRAAVEFAGNVTGLNAALDLLKARYAAAGEAGFAKIGVITKLGSTLSTLAAGGIAATVVALGALVLKYKEILEADSELSKALATSGAALGITKDQAVTLSQSFENVGVGALKASEVISTFAKETTISQGNLVNIMSSVVEYSKYTGTSIEDLAKQYAKIQADPVKALVEIAEKTGLVNTETIKQVASLVRQGEQTEAVRIATEAWGNTMKAESAEVKNNLSGVEGGWITIKSAVSKVSDEITTLTRNISDSLGPVFKTVWQTVAVIVSEVWFTIKGVAREIGVVGATLGALIKGDFSAAKTIWEESKKDAAGLREEHDNLIASILEKGKQEQKNATENKKANSEQATQLGILEKALDKLDKMEDKANQKKLSQAEFRKKYVEDAMKDAVKGTNLSLADLQVNKELTDVLQKQADVEYQRLHKKDGQKEKNAAIKQAAKDLEVYTDLLNVADGLSAKYNNTLEALQRQRANHVITEDEYIAAVEKLIQMQPFAIKQAEDLAKAQELEAKLLDRVTGKGADYTKTLKQIEEASKFMLNGKLYFSPEDIQKMKENLEKLTPEYKKQQKAIEDAQKAYNKYADDVQKSLDNTQVENSKLDDRVALLGLTANEQEKLSKQQDINNKLLAVDLKMRREILKIQADQKLAADPIAQLTAIKEVEYAAAEERKMLNRQVAIQAAEDFDKEYRKVKEGISESIVTALFEGGKAGSQKIRNILMETLRKPVTLVVNAVVNTLMGTVTGALFGTSAATATGSSLLGTGSSLLGGAGALGLLGTFGGGLSAGFGGLAGTLGLTATGTTLGGALSAGTIALQSGNILGGLGTFLGALGPILGGLSLLFGGDIFGSLFGRKLKDSGLEGEFGGSTGFEGNTYRYYKGGLFRSNKTTREKLDEETRAGFATQFQEIKTSVEGMGSALGLGSDLLKDFTYKFKLSLKGLSEEEAAAKIQEEFKKMAEEMGKIVLVTDEYTRSGETQLEALTRLSTSLLGVNAMLDTLGIKMYETSLAGADMASSLVDLFGDLETMQAAVTSYYDAYYSEEEKKATLTRQLTKQFKDQNLELPKSREEYRRLVESMDLTTEEGRKMYAFLITLSPTFAMIAESTEDLAAKAKALAEEIASKQFDLDNELLRAQGREQEAVNRERAKELEALKALDPKLAATQEEIWRLNDAAAAKAKADKEAADAEAAREKARSAALTALQKAINQEKQILQERIAAAQESVNTLKAIFDLLETSIKTLYNQVDSTSSMTYANARKVITGAVATVKAGGNVQGITGLDTAVNDALSGLSADNYATKVEYDRERLRLADELKSLQGSAKKELTNAEKQLDSLNEQVKQLDEILEFWQMQVDIANGTYVATVSVEQAIRDLHKALFAEKEAAAKPANPSGGGSGNTYVEQPGGASLGGSTGQGTGRKVTGYTADGRAVWSDGTVEQYAPGQYGYDGNQLSGTGNLTAEQWEKLKSGGSPFGGYWVGTEYRSNGSYKWDEAKQMYVPAFAGGGSYQGGLALVGEEGPELINFNQGGHISTAADTSAMLQASAERVQVLENALMAMRQDMKDIASYTKRTRDVLNNVTPNGNVLQVETLAE